MSEITPPSSPLLADLKYPKHIQKLISAHEADYAVFAEKETVYMTALEDLKQAQAEDIRLLVDAVAEGKDDPGTPNEDKLKREVIYSLEAVRQARSKAQKSSVVLSQALRENVSDVALLAVEKARAGVEAWQTTISRLQAEYAEAVDARRRSQDGLVMVSHLPTKGISFHANYPIPSDARFPETHEKAVLGACNLLEQMVIRSEVPEELVLEEADLAESAPV